MEEKIREKYLEMVSWYIMA